MIGSCEWIFGARPLERTVAVLAAAGVDGLEVSGEPERDAGGLAAALGSAGIAPLGTTAVSRWPTAERDLAHAERAARRRAVAYYRGCIDLAAALGAPVVAVIPGAVGRVEPLTSAEREWRYAVEGIRELSLYAGEQGVTVAVEAINRYETHIVNRVEQALALAAAAGGGVGVVADTVHMQLEESDPAGAVAQAGASLCALHVADSNRRGLGHGTLDVAPIVAAARRGGFRGPLVLECTAAGPDPFAADKGAEAMRILDVEVAESVRILRRLEDGDD